MKKKKKKVKNEETREWERERETQGNERKYKAIKTGQKQNPKHMYNVQQTINVKNKK